MKLRRGLIALILSLMIVSQVYSQNSPNNIEREDSIKVSFNDIVSASKAFTELDGIDSVLALKDGELESQGIETRFYKDGLDDCIEANNTLTQVTIPLLQSRDSIHNNQYLAYKKAYSQEKTKKIITIIGIPVVAILSFVVGFLIAH